MIYLDIHGIYIYMIYIYIYVYNYKYIYIIYIYVQFELLGKVQESIKHSLETQVRD